MVLEIVRTICCIAPHFDPGYKAGGTLRSLYNFCEVFKDYYVIDVVTSSSDLGSRKTYDDVCVDKSLDRGGYSVFYGGSLSSKIREVYRLCSNDPTRIIYINSFFDPKNSIAILIISKIFFLKNPIIIAPRGELSDQALCLKKFKKMCYLAVFRIFFHSTKIVFQASSEHEKLDIERSIKGAVIVKIATDVPMMVQVDESNDQNFVTSKSLRIVSVARISRIKNFEFMLNVLGHIRDTSIEYNIYGDVDDVQYLKDILSMSEGLPSNIAFSYCGAVVHDELHSIFRKHHLSVLPSLSENFGHVVYESLSSGVPVICSYDTPWRDFASDYLRCCRLNESLWTDHIKEFARSSPTDLKSLSKKSTAFAQSFSENSGIRKSYEELFHV